MRRRFVVPEPGPAVEVELTDAAFGGEALGHLPDGRVVFVPRTLPGERAIVRVQQDKRDFARGELESLLQTAPGRVEPPCPYYSQGCGGCSWQHADYAVQLMLKTHIVVDQLRRIGHFAEAADLVKPAIGMIEPWHYRNQARFTVGRRFGELCFTLRGSHRLLRIDHCWIVHPRINDVVEIAQGRLAELNRRIHQVSIRVGANTGEMLIAPALPEVPELDSGQPYFEEELLGRRFRLQPPSFFQVNTRREARQLPAAIRQAWLPVPADGISLAELLALLVLDRLEPSPDSKVVDAYGGVGTFAILAAPLVGEVIGIEEAKSAVRDAQYNARDLSNVRFIQARTEVALPLLEEQPSAVILDPARVGCHPDVLTALLRLRPGRIVYVSCDPSTLARDLRGLVDGGYTLDEVQPLDMFPQTYHIENVATLTL
ncbi:MAG TPA: class I SAM-dependent RNA methyltransferase [Chloroflexota bacterium]|nr:class I SAM-dependent RNA methyltransferase [Chloroflexota bacterium]